jgi:hypothetical protein
MSLAVRIASRARGQEQAPELRRAAPWCATQLRTHVEPHTHTRNNGPEGSLRTTVSTVARPNSTHWRRRYGCLVCLFRG